ncbi:MAG: class I SAM-dependent methyltransferase [Acidobacteria bacterium]|nr:class I SAM-dependent methyltransferase [Acidobacteriota bacterium]
MKALVSPDLEQYAARHTTPEPELLAELRAATHASMALPQMQVGLVEGSFLKMLVALTSARRVVEVGMFTGYSALMMASALPADGRLFTCDVDPEACAMARSFFARSPHGKKIEILMGPARETLPRIPGPVDLVFIDADKAVYPHYYDQIVDKVRPGGLLVFDNMLWSGEVLDPADEDARALVATARQVQNDPRVENVLLTVRDGMLLARRL